MTASTEMRPNGERRGGEATRPAAPFPSIARIRPATSRPRPSSRVLLLAACALLLAAAAHAADPFYTRMLREGTDAYNRKEYATAVQKLRIACFGFLDEPEVLADGLTRLALAQGASGDVKGFAETFERIAEVEDRFQGYTRAKTPAEVRAAFERLVLQIIPRATLAERPGFARLIAPPAERLAKATPTPRRREPERRAAAEPKGVTGSLTLADQALSLGDAKGALAAADNALAIEPGNREALRLRGLAFAADRRWQPALDDLTGSGAVGSDRAATEAGLRSLVELARFEDASALYGRLPKALAADPAIQRLGRVAAVGVEQARSTPPPVPPPTVPPTYPPQPSPPPTATPTPAATPTPTPTPSPSAPPAPTSTPPSPAKRPTAKAAGRTPTAQEQTELDAIRGLLNAGRLDDALARSRSLADGQKDLAEAQFLAAEMAYRTRRFAEAVSYFRRVGDPGDGQPVLLFYYAVSLYETGDRKAAGPLLERSLPKIKRTAFVDGYVLKILGPNVTPVTRP